MRPRRNRVPAALLDFTAHFAYLRAPLGPRVAVYTDLSILRTLVFPRTLTAGRPLSPSASSFALRGSTRFTRSKARMAWAPIAPIDDGLVGARRRSAASPCARMDRRGAWRATRRGAGCPAATASAHAPPSGGPPPPPPVSGSGTLDCARARSPASPRDTPALSTLAGARLLGVSLEPLSTLSARPPCLLRQRRPRPSFASPSPQALDPGHFRRADQGHSSRAMKHRRDR